MAGFSDTRRNFLRVIAPAVALPVVAQPLQAKEVRLVTREEIMDAFRLYDMMELRAADLNARYQLLIEMLFETNPERLRDKLQALRDARHGHSVLVDPSTGRTAPYHPDMYDEQGRIQASYFNKPVDGIVPPKLKTNKLFKRVARGVRQKVIGV